MQLARKQSETTYVFIATSRGSSMSENNVYRELIKTPKTYLMQLVSVLHLLVSALLCFEEIEREDNLYIHFNQTNKTYSKNLNISQVQYSKIQISVNFLFKGALLLLHTMLKMHFASTCCANNLHTAKETERRRHLTNMQTLSGKTLLECCVCIFVYI